MLLAEANQWPADVVEYFGDPDTGGDECHMAFHFPLMPRIFMAVRRESRRGLLRLLVSELRPRRIDLEHRYATGLRLRRLTRNSSSGAAALLNVACPKCCGPIWAGSKSLAETGFSLAWFAVQGVDQDEFLERAGFEDTGEIDEYFEEEHSGGALPGGSPHGFFGVGEPARLPPN